MKNIFLIKCRIVFIAVLMLLYTTTSIAQKWVDTSYTIQQTKNVSYGKAIDFAGTNRDLTVDVCTPTNDQIPSCGRPLLVVIHGGSLIAGSKDDIAQQQMMKDFAKRGYVTASINYRLGMFNTNSKWHCNITYFGAPWDCLNAQDSIEFYRALYRAMQDAKGAVRFLISDSSYHINSNNVFLIGESAGGFVAMSTAFMDDPKEKDSIYGSQAAMKAPYIDLEAQCIQGYNLASSIASMKLSRPDLGSIDGDLNLNSKSYQIKGVASFYGGVLTDMFAKYTYSSPPLLYLYHQPNDMLVPYKQDYIYAGLAACAVNNAGCAYLINRPHCSGSSSINRMIAAYRSSGLNMPKVVFDSTNNNADCLTQVFDPSKMGHAIDNYKLRTENIAQLFAQKIDTTDCTSAIITVVPEPLNISLFPNPASNKLMVVAHQNLQGESEIIISNILGEIVYNNRIDMVQNQEIDITKLTQGVFYIYIKNNRSEFRSKFIKL